MLPRRPCLRMLRGLVLAGAVLVTALVASTLVGARAGDEHEPDAVAPDRAVVLAMPGGADGAPARLTGDERRAPSDRPLTPRTLLPAVLAAATLLFIRPPRRARLLDTMRRSPSRPRARRSVRAPPVRQLIAV